MYARQSAIFAHISIADYLTVTHIDMGLSCGVTAPHIINKSQRLRSWLALIKN